MSDYLVGKFERLPSRKSVKKALKGGLVYSDGIVLKTGDWSKPDQTISLVELESGLAPIYELKIEVVYEDQYLAVINKPAGISVNGNNFRTIENTLQFNLKPSTEVDALQRPLPVHRLDNPTSGLLVIAKTKIAQIELGKLFQEKKIEKTYAAIVIGATESGGRITDEIEGKVALTDFEKMNEVKSLKNKVLSLLKLKPATGRTHQIRIHLAKQGTPILGDSIYGIEGLILKNKGLFLSAIALEFIHPISKERLHIKIELPHKFVKRLKNEQRRWDARRKG